MADFPSLYVFNQNCLKHITSQKEVSVMEKENKWRNYSKKPIVICVMALICCALWGSAFPCVKIGYELLQMKNDRKPDFVCRIPIFGAGILTFLMGCIIEKRVLTLKKSAIPYVAGIGIFQTTLQYIIFLYRNG